MSLRNKLVGMGALAAFGVALAGGAEPVADACSVCGFGFVDYYEWRCDPAVGWQLALVGQGAYKACGGPPILEWGVETECADILRDVGGGGEDDGSCSSFDCPPMPTTACYKPTWPTWYKAPGGVFSP